METKKCSKLMFREEKVKKESQSVNPQAKLNNKLSFRPSKTFNKKTYSNKYSYKMLK
jgi:hypothetical protein